MAASGNEKENHSNPNHAQNGETATIPDAEPPSEAPAVVDDNPDYSILTTCEKRGIVLGAAIGAFFSPLTAQIYFPALNLLAEDLHVSVTQINLTVTTYMIFQGITPMFIGSFADSTGRRPAYMICFIIYMGANIGCALAPNYAAILVLRMVQSAGSSTTVALCQAVVSDVVTSAERGQYVGFTVVPIILAPSIGPVMGGVLSQYLGWRWIFWFLTILSGIVFVLFAFFMPETCRSLVGDGSIRPHPAYRTFWQISKDYLRARRARKHPDSVDLQRTKSHVSTSPVLHIKGPNPLPSLTILFEKEMFLLLTYSGLVFAGFYAMATAMPPIFSDLYGFNDLTIGLMYLPMGGGSIVAALVMGKLINWNYRRHCKKLGVPFDRKKQQDLTEFPIEKARLEVAIPLLVLSMATVVAWGWAVQYRANLAVPCVLMFLQGISMVGFNNTTSTLLVDVNPGNAGAATASSNLTRCLIGAGITAAIDPMIKAMGIGWAFTLLGIVFLFGIPILWLIMTKGVAWRKAKEERTLRRKKKKVDGMIKHEEEH